MNAAERFREIATVEHADEYGVYSETLSVSTEGVYELYTDDIDSVDRVSKQTAALWVAKHTDLNLGDLI